MRKFNVTLNGYDKNEVNYFVNEITREYEKILEKLKAKDREVELLEQQMTQKLFDILQYYLPEGWQEVNFFAGYYKNDCGYFKYWVKMENGQYIDCFRLISQPKPGEKDILQEQLIKLHKEIFSIRSKLSEKDKWVCMEFVVSNQGKLAKNYDYADGVEKDNLMQYVTDYKDKLNQRYN